MIKLTFQLILLMCFANGLQVRVHQAGGIRFWKMLLPAATDLLRHCSPRWTEDTSGRIHTTTSLLQARLHAHYHDKKVPALVAQAANGVLRSENATA